MMRTSNGGTSSGLEATGEVQHLFLARRLLRVGVCCLFNHCPTAPIMGTTPPPAGPYAGHHPPLPTDPLHHCKGGGWTVCARAFVQPFFLGGVDLRRVANHMPTPPPPRTPSPPTNMPHQPCTGPCTLDPALGLPPESNEPPFPSASSPTSHNTHPVQYGVPFLELRRSEGRRQCTGLGTPCDRQTRTCACAPPRPPRQWRQ